MTGYTLVDDGPFYDLRTWGLGRAAVCDCGTPWTFLLPFFCIPRLLCLCRVETLESLPVHSFNDAIISSARFCTLQSPFVFLFLMIHLVEG